MNLRLAARPAALVVVLSAALAWPAFAVIGENFAAGGVGLRGAFIFDLNTGDLEDEYLSWSISVSPEVSLYVARNLSLGIQPGFSYRVTRNNPQNIYRSTSATLSLTAEYAFVAHPEASNGLVPSLGVILGAALYPGLDDVVGGATRADSSMEVDLSLSPLLTVYYFLTDRFSPFVSFCPTFSFIVFRSTAAGQTETLDGTQRVDIYMRARIGFTYHIPNKDATVIGK